MKILKKFPFFKILFYLGCFFSLMPMFFIFDILRAESIRQYLVNNVLGKASGNVDQMIYHYDVLSDMRNYDLIEEERWFLEYDDEEWIQENSGGFPRFDENDISKVVYHGELYAGEFKGRLGYYTTQITAYPLRMALRSVDEMKKWTYATVHMILVVIILFCEYNFIEIKADKKYRNLLIKGLAREIKTPLESLKTGVEDWANATDTERNDYSEKVICDIGKMDSVIRKQIKLRDIESGRIDLDFEEVNLYYFTNMVIDSLVNELSNKNLTVSIDSSIQEDCIIEADPEVLKMIIGNLFLISAENSDSEVLIAIEPSDSGQEVEFEIESDDYPITDSEAKRIWYKASMEDEARTNKFGSIGAGLVAIRPMLKAHHAHYGCSPTATGVILWFSMQRINTDDE